MKKLLIIGASGSLGQGLVSSLKKDYDITATYYNNKMMRDDVKTIQLDITDIKSFDKLSNTKYDTVILVAGMMPANMKGYNPQSYIDVNVTGTLNVLEFCREQNINKIIYIMTFSDVSGSFYSGIPIKRDEIRSLNYKGDHAVYAITKVTACELLEHYHQDFGMQTIIFRIPTVYCDDENYFYYVDGKQRTKAYFKMIKSVVEDKKIEIWGNPTNAKDMPYIKDFARLIGKAVENTIAQGIYNAGTEQPISLEEFINAIIKVFSSDSDEVQKIYKPEKPSQPNFTFDMSETNKEFQFNIKYDLITMLEEMKQNIDLDKIR